MVFLKVLKLIFYYKKYLNLLKIYFEITKDTKRKKFKNK